MRKKTIWPQGRLPSNAPNGRASWILTLVIGSFLCGLIVICLTASQLSAEETPTTWEFFAFDNGVGRGALNPAEQAEILADLGYQGIGYTGVDNIPAMLQALQARRLKMYSTYIQVNLDAGEAPYDRGLPQAIQQLKGQGTALWIHLHGAQSPSTALDERAVEVIRQIAEMAEAAGLRVVLYPHTGFYVATTTDAVRVVKKVDRRNVGASLNLCHFLKQNDERVLEQRLQEVMPHLFLVSINGCDSGDTRKMEWDRLIQTLDRGSFDVGHVLRLLKQGGYKGPIGLQCYAIKGDMRENLKRSMKAWIQLNKGLPKG